MNIFSLLRDKKTIIYNKHIDEVKAELSNRMYQVLGDEGLILDTGLFIGCTIEYYCNNDKSKDIKPGTKTSVHKCFFSQQSLNITGVPNKDCATCHLRAIELYENQQISRRRR